jgi:hypothetical protein
VPSQSSSSSISTLITTNSISTPDVYSDVLYQPHLCLSYDLDQKFSHLTLDSDKPHKVASIRRVNTIESSPDQEPLTLSEPLILTNLFSPSLISPISSLKKISELFPKTTLFRAESSLLTIEQYATYCSDCDLEDMPLYLFESIGEAGSEKERGFREGGCWDGWSGMQRWFGNACPRTSPGSDMKERGMDLFDVLGKERPEFRWLVSILKT